MSFDSDRIKQADEKTKLLIFGYMRESQSELSHSNDNRNNIIPDLITYTCLLFYYIGELFGVPPDCLKLSGSNNNTITRIKESGSTWSNSIYGKQWIASNENNIYQWNIKVNKNPKRWGIAIGIVSNKHDQDIKENFDRHHSYCYYNSEGFQYSEGDTMTFILDLSKAQILCYKNNETSKQTVLFSDIKKSSDIQYKLAVTICHSNDSITVSL